MTFMDGSAHGDDRSPRKSHPLFASMRKLRDSRDDHNKETLVKKGEAPRDVLSEGRRGLDRVEEVGPEEG